MTESRICAVESFAVRIPRDVVADRGTAGSPAKLRKQGGSAYSIAQTYSTVYSNSIESTLVKVTTENGLVGWGEAQAPVAPEAAQSIITHLLRPLLLGRDALAPAALRTLLYDAMRVRGHFGGFYGDALAAIDCALWDIAGQHCKEPVYRMLGGPARQQLPIYISGLAGDTLEEKLTDAEGYVRDGFRAFKIFLPEGEDECLALIEHLRQRFGNEIKIFVDALWRLEEKTALHFAQSLAEYNVSWLEAPLAPENVEGHQRLSAQSPIPIALGESYRSVYEVLPFLRSGAVQILQPDIGRIGITEGVRIGSLAQAFHVPIALHLSIALGPQIGAALQVAAALPNLLYVECNPRVLRVAQRFCHKDQLHLGGDGFSLPVSPGLGISMNEEELMKFFSSSNVT